MMEAYIGQIEIFAFGFAPRNWAVCAGQLLPINQNQALFSLLGTTYGGNGTTTFALPNLQGRVAVGQGNGQGLTPHLIGETGGEETHTLVVTEIAGHSHTLNTAAQAAVTGNVDTPGPSVVLAATAGKDKQGAPLAVPIYVVDSAPNQPMSPSALGLTGGQAHSNFMPYTAVNYCIALTGIFPSRS